MTALDSTKRRSSSGAPGRGRVGMVVPRGARAGVVAGRVLAGAATLVAVGCWLADGPVGANRAWAAELPADAPGTPAVDDGSGSNQRVDEDQPEPDESGHSRPGVRGGGPTAEPGHLDPEDAPAATDAPQLRNLEPVTRLYIDGSYAQTPDLSALPFVLGSGSNTRGAVGGSLKWRRFQFETELPSAQSTTLFLTAVPGGMPIPEDQHQTSRAIGDWRLGAQWTEALPAAITPSWLDWEGGISLRARIPTHTTRFQFHLVDGTLGVYRFPYYFHLEPALLLGGAVGPLSFVVNQGALVLVGPDGSFGDLYFRVPTLFFWDAHYALALRLASFLSVYSELATVFQGNRIADPNFQKLNGIRSVAFAPGLGIRLPLGIRIDVILRWAVTRDANLFGVISYAGSRSGTVRVSVFF